MTSKQVQMPAQLSLTSATEQRSLTCEHSSALPTFSRSRLEFQNRTTWQPSFTKHSTHMRDLRTVRVSCRVQPWKAFSDAQILRLAVIPMRSQLICCNLRLINFSRI